MIEQFEIASLEIKNYRKYESLTLRFPEDTEQSGSAGAVLLIGENGCGKTTVLDAIATLLGGYLQALGNIPSGDRHPIKKHDIRLEVQDIEDNIVVDYKLPVEVGGVLRINQRHVELHRTRNGLVDNTQTQLPKQKNPELFDWAQQLDSTENKVLPILSYHGTGRLWEQDYKKTAKMEKLSRHDGYKDALNAKSNYRNFIAWFAKQEKNAFNLRKPIPILETVRKVVMEMLAIITHKQVELFIYREGDLEIKYQGETQREKVSNLSDGYRNLIGIVSDIAYRMALLNPALLTDVTKITPGIVLIDEIDLHLHPKWQRQVFSILRELFPRVQFIATSHSPFIIQSMAANEIIRLDDSAQNLELDSSLLSIEDIAETIQQVELPQISQRKQRMLNAAEEYLNLLDKFEASQQQSELAHIKQKLDALIEPFEDNMAYVAFLKRKRLLAESKAND